MSTDDDKGRLDAHNAAAEINENEHVDEKRGNAADRADMYRMGKTQEMKVRTGTHTLLWSWIWVNAT